MGSTTLLWIILAAIVALAFAAFQYRIGVKNSTRKSIIYGMLRFLSVFGLLLLLVNPKWTQVSYYEEKPTLAIAVDNTKSIKHLGYDTLVDGVLERFRESKRLQDNFDLQVFKFGDELRLLDSLDYTGKQTNLAKVFSSLNSLYKKGVSPTIVITDGNQTLGRDYLYEAKEFENPVYPVVVGDTIQYADSKIERVNVNRYAYINNKFPVEVFLKYTGEISNQSATLEIRAGNRTVHTERITFSKESTSIIRTVILPADKVGLSRYTVSISPSSSEKNTENNYRNFAIEVIDQKTNVLVVSNLVHPDIGMFKKSIETNTLRELTILNTEESQGELNAYQLVLLYQPDEQFAQILKELEELNKNNIVVTGSKTNWRFLNEAQSYAQREITGQTEEVQATLNTSFSSFTIQDIGFSDFPPLLGSFGDVRFNGESDIALFQSIGNLDTDQPLLVASESRGQRVVYLFGEGIWKWRAQSFVDKRDFKDFDNFIDKLVQYAASNKRKTRLDLSYDSFYYGNSAIKISAQYFDKNYIFDGRSSINATVIQKETKEQYKAPFILKGNYYELDLSNLAAGDYNFTVQVADQGLQRSGSFTIIPFEAELQFLNADIQALTQLADENEGEIYSLNQAENLISLLVSDDRYRPLQKSSEKVVPLIDRKWLLGLVILFLAIEWFMRKYHGLT